MLSSLFHRSVAPFSKMSIDSRLHHLTNGATTCPNDAAGDDEGDGFLFDPTILRNIPWSPESQKKFKAGISAHSPGHELLLRPLHINDYQKGAWRALHSDFSPSLPHRSAIVGHVYFELLKFLLLRRHWWRRRMLRTRGFRSLIIFRGRRNSSCQRCRGGLPGRTKKSVWT